MLSFCINTVHSLLTLSSLEREPEYEHERDSHCQNILSGLQTLTKDSQKPVNVLQSVTIKKNEMGFIDGVLGNSACSVMEAMNSCTESLGIESSDQLEEDVDIDEKRLVLRSRLKRRRMVDDRRSEDVKKKIFPPPLSSFNENFYFKSMRNNGRLEIKEVRIDRKPDFLHASRHNGRLTLHLIEPVHVPNVEKEEELKESVESVEEVKESVGNVERLRYYASYRRCYDLTRYHNQPIWSNHCVMTG
ncbi:hypothetical protein IFM89_000921 [Coptis chinensis]|uniref:FAF domain-containing protein n=1 Tax=Coptis chinensis TaxID=261450 RepID=A0A835IIA2_9MAGN|nr:hypothetical protein IFM89_000921 [Coptis chinensis]